MNNKKFPVLKCTKELWTEIRPIIESYNITIDITADEYRDINCYLVSNFGCDTFTTLIIGFTSKDLCDTGLRYLVNTKDEFLLAVAKLAGKEYNSIITFNNSNIEKINIAEKLKHCKKDTKLYHLLFGEVKFDSINNKDKYIKIIIIDENNNKSTFCVNFNGIYDLSYPNGECLLFPSKDNRDWNNFQILEEGHRVMCSNNGEDWKFREYIKDNITNCINSKDIYSNWLYIVPVEDFNFTTKDITINKEKSII